MNAHDSPLAGVVLSLPSHTIAKRAAEMRRRIIRIHRRRQVKRRTYHLFLSLSAARSPLVFRVSHLLLVLQSHNDERCQSRGEPSYRCLTRHSLRPGRERVGQRVRQCAEHMRGRLGGRAAGFWGRGTEG
jgi:hypothetical protein